MCLKFGPYKTWGCQWANVTERFKVTYKMALCLKSICYVAVMVWNFHCCTDIQHKFGDCFVISRSNLAKMAHKSTTKQPPADLVVLCFCFHLWRSESHWISILNDLANDLSFITSKTTKSSTCCKYLLLHVSCPTLTKSLSLAKKSIFIFFGK